MGPLPPDGEDRRKFLIKAGTVVGATAWAVPTMQIVRMTSAGAQTTGSVVATGPPSTTASPPRSIPHSLHGGFVSEADPGSDPFWNRLENGSFDGTYVVEEGTFPAISGSSFGIPEFDIALRDEQGDAVIRYVSGRDSGGFFADVIGPGSGDGFVFSDGKTQFQLGFATGFDGSGASVTGAVFDGGGSGPPGEINVSFGVAAIGVSTL